MAHRHQPYLRDLLRAVATSDGDLSQQIREDLLAGKSLTGALGSFAIKVAHNPTSITDEHVKALRDAGYSEDQIFECIIAAAVGAGVERLRKGLALVGEEP
jgi:alkylhydroperoxidase family enzyme